MAKLNLEGKEYDIPQEVFDHIKEINEDRLYLLRDIRLISHKFYVIIDTLGQIGVKMGNLFAKAPLIIARARKNPRMFFVDEELKETIKEFANEYEQYENTENKR